MTDLKRLFSKKMLRRMLVILLAVLIVLFSSLFVVSRTIGRVRLSNLADVFTGFSVKGDGGFPYVTDAGSVVRLVQMGGGIGVLRTDRFDVLTRSGALLQSVQHTYTSPAVQVCGGRALLFDRGGTRYMLLSKTAKLRAGETDKPILTAALDENGQIAVAVSSDNTKSILTAYKTNGEAFFQFKCVAEYVTDIAFTRDGVALTVVGAKNASAYSRLLELRFGKTETLADYTYDGTSLFHVHAVGSTVTACSSTLLTTLRHKTQQPEMPFGSDTLQFFSADGESGKSTLALLTYGNEHASKLRGISANGETAFEAECGEKLKDMSRSSTYTCVLTDEAVLTYNNSGAHVGTVTLTQAARSICLNDRTVFVLYNDHIDAFPAAGEHTDG